MAVRERSQRKEKSLYFCTFNRRFFVFVFGFFVWLVGLLSVVVVLYFEHLYFAPGPTNYVGGFASREC